jgi:hypothetical protein
MKTKTMLHAIRALNWQGHVELPDVDVIWLAEALASCLNANEDATVCGICSQFKDITVETKLGRICEDCISDITDVAEQTRDQLEGD